MLQIRVLAGLLLTFVFISSSFKVKDYFDSEETETSTISPYRKCLCVICTPHVLLQDRWLGVFNLSIQLKRFAENPTLLQFNAQKGCLIRSRNCFAFDCFALFDLSSSCVLCAQCHQRLSIVHSSLFLL